MILLLPAGLQALYDKYKDQDFTILGFPCNQVCLFPPPLPYPASPYISYLVWRSGTSRWRRSCRVLYGQSWCYFPSYEEIWCQRRQHQWSLQVFEVGEVWYLGPYSYQGEYLRSSETKKQSQWISCASGTLRNSWSISRATLLNAGLRPPLRKLSMLRLRSYYSQLQIKGREVNNV